MRTRLVGDDVGRDTTAYELWEHVSRIGHDSNRQRTTVPCCRLHAGKTVIEVVGDLVEIAVVLAALCPGRIDLDAEHRSSVAGDGERLGAAHPAESGGEDPMTGKAATEVLVGDLGERRVRALQDALRADVDPRAG